jgi:hypothetical protein
MACSSGEPDLKYIGIFVKDQNSDLVKLNPLAYSANNKSLQTTKSIDNKLTLYLYQENFNENDLKVYQTIRFDRTELPILVEPLEQPDRYALHITLMHPIDDSPVVALKLKRKRYALYLGDLEKALVEEIQNAQSELSDKLQLTNEYINAYPKFNDLAKLREDILEEIEDYKTFEADSGKSQFTQIYQQAMAFRNQLNSQLGSDIYGYSSVSLASSDHIVEPKISETELFSAIKHADKQNDLWELVESDYTNSNLNLAFQISDKAHKDNQGLIIKMSRNNEYGWGCSVETSEAKDLSDVKKIKNYFPRYCNHTG